MKGKKLDANIFELSTKFFDQEITSKKRLREFYLHLNPNLSENDFRRILYGLEKNRVIVPAGRGVFVLHIQPPHPRHMKHKFVPTVSSRVNQINGELREAFPFLNYLIWETRILHEFMVHQPGQNQIVVETEKGTDDSVFNYLTEKYPGQTFLNPDRTIVERYAFQHAEPIVVSRLVTQTPMGKKVKGVPYSKLEKVLVDVLVDADKYFIFQGQELVSIFENAFSRYLIDEKSMLRYAGRRNAATKLKQFVLTQTRVEFRQLTETSI